MNIYDLIDNIKTITSTDDKELIYLDSNLKKSIREHINLILTNVKSSCTGNKTYYPLNYSVPSERVKKYMEALNNKKVSNISKADIILVDENSLYKILKLTEGYYTYGVKSEGKIDTRKINITKRELFDNRSYSLYYVEKEYLIEALKRLNSLDFTKLYDIHKNIEKSYPDLTLYEFYNKFSKMIDNTDVFFKKIALLNMYNNYNSYTVANILSYHLSNIYKNTTHNYRYEMNKFINLINSSSVHTKYLYSFFDKQYMYSSYPKYSCSNLFKNSKNHLYEYYLKYHPYTSFMYINSYVGLFKAIHKNYSEKNVSQESIKILTNVIKFKDIMLNKDLLVGIVVNSDEIVHLKNNLIDLENKSEEDKNKILSEVLTIFDSLLSKENVIGTAEEVHKILVD